MVVNLTIALKFREGKKHVFVKCSISSFLGFVSMNAPMIISLPINLFVRVNIIGEHIDYCGYPVLPMALEQNIMVAVAVSSDTTKLQLANVNPKYRSYECDITAIEWVHTFCILQVTSLY